MNSEELTAYVEALMFIATIDEKIDENELEYFNQIGTMYGIAPAEIEIIKESVLGKEKTLMEILAPISKRNAKLSLVYQLLALCYADGSYDIIEKKGMQEICNILGVEASKLAELESVMLESIKLQEKINIILER